MRNAMTPVLFVSAMLGCGLVGCAMESPEAAGDDIAASQDELVLSCGASRTMSLARGGTTMVTVATSCEQNAAGLVRCGTSTTFVPPTPAICDTTRALENAKAYLLQRCDAERARVAPTPPTCALASCTGSASYTGSCSIVSAGIVETHFSPTPVLRPDVRWFTLTCTSTVGATMVQAVTSRCSALAPMPSQSPM